MKILIADDHPVYIEGLKNLLNSYGFEVCGMARNGEDAVRLCKKDAPDVVLMDANMPVVDGIEATRQIIALGADTKVVILTGMDNDSILLKAMQAGASGFLLKNLDGDALCKSLNELAEGRNPFSPGLESLLLKKIASSSKQEERPLPELKARDRKILELLSKGLTYKEISDEIELSEPGVKYHIKKLKEKLGVKKQADLAAAYVRAQN